MSENIQFSSLSSTKLIENRAKEYDIGCMGVKGQYIHFATRPIYLAPPLPEDEKRLKFYQPKIHISLQISDRLRFFEKLVQNAQGIGLKAWKMKHLRIGQSGSAEAGLADFVIYTQNSYDEDEETVSYVRETVLALNQLLDEMNVGEVNNVPRFSIGVKAIGETPIHSAITLSQGSGADKALSPKGYLENFDDSTGGALSNSLVNEYEAQGIELEYVNISEQ